MRKNQWQWKQTAGSKHIDIEFIQILQNTSSRYVGSIVCALVSTPCILK